MGLIVEFAKDILKDAELLEQQLEAINAPKPSFESGAPATFPHESQYPEIFQTRHEIINKSKAVHELALGPSILLQHISGVGRYQGFALHVIEHYGIHHHVPRSGSITFKDLASKLNVNGDILARILRFALSARIFQEKPLGSISHNAISEALPGLSGWHNMILSDDFTASIQAWPKALKAYDENAGAKNLPWNIGNDDERPFFTRLDTGADSFGGMKAFTAAMESRTKVNGGSDIWFSKLGFDWRSLGEGPLVDVGGGSGHITTPIVRDTPDLRLIVQDLPSNESAAKARFTAAGIENRAWFQTQDFFQPQPQELQPKAYFLRSILHDWNDVDCVRILKQLLPGVERGARIFAMDRVAYLPGEGQFPNFQESGAQFMDLMMWTLLGAKERNIEQWKTLVAQVDSRLKIIEYRTLVGCDWAMLELSF